MSRKIREPDTSLHMDNKYILSKGQQYFYLGTISINVVLGVLAGILGILIYNWWYFLLILGSIALIGLTIFDVLKSRQYIRLITVMAILLGIFACLILLIMVDTLVILGIVIIDFLALCYNFAIGQKIDRFRLGQ